MPVSSASKQEARTFQHGQVLADGGPRDVELCCDIPGRPALGPPRARGSAGQARPHAGHLRLPVLGGLHLGVGAPARRAETGTGVLFRHYGFADGYPETRPRPHRADLGDGHGPAGQVRRHRKRRSRCSPRPTRNPDSTWKERACLSTREPVAGLMPDADLRVVPGGHAPWFHHADLVAAADREFLEGLAMSTDSTMLFGAAATVLFVVVVHGCWPPPARARRGGQHTGSETGAGAGLSERTNFPAPAAGFTAARDRRAALWRAWSARFWSPSPPWLPVRRDLRPRDHSAASRPVPRAGPRGPQPSTPKGPRRRRAAADLRSARHLCRGGTTAVRSRARFLTHPGHRRRQHLHPRVADGRLPARRRAHPASAASPHRHQVALDHGPEPHLVTPLTTRRSTTDHDHPTCRDPFCSLCRRGARGSAHEARR